MLRPNDHILIGELLCSVVTSEIVWLASPNSRVRLTLEVVGAPQYSNQLILFLPLDLPMWVKEVEE
jgi:hypothetical protein